jgi:thiamine pyrophosphokinase
MSRNALESVQCACARTFVCVRACTGGRIDQELIGLQRIQRTAAAAGDVIRICSIENHSEMLVEY